MLTRFIIFIPFLLNLIRSEETIHTFNFEDSCGGTIRDNAGIIILDGRNFTTDFHGNKCKLDIIPLGDDSRIFFYFEEFQFPNYRSEENMTITEGGYRKRAIEGLTGYMYGTNTTLVSKEQNFTTSGPKMEITYNCNTKNGAPPSGTFRLVYLRFTTNSNCGSEDEHLCPNGNCVDKQYYCSPEIRACTNDDLDCDTEQSERLVDTILDIVKLIGWITLVVILCCVIRTMSGRYRIDICRAIKRRPICFQRSAVELEPHNSEEHRPLHLENVEVNTRHNSEEHRPLQLENVEVNIRHNSEEHRPLQLENVEGNIRHNSEEHRPSQLENVEVNTRVQPDVTETESDHVSLTDSRRHSDALYSLPVLPRVHAPLSSLIVDAIMLQIEQYTVYPSAPPEPPPSYESEVVPSYDEVMSDLEKYKHSGFR